MVGVPRIRRDAPRARMVGRRGRSAQGRGRGDRRRDRARAGRRRAAGERRAFRAPVGGHVRGNRPDGSGRVRRRKRPARDPPALPAARADRPPGAGLRGAGRPGAREVTAAERLGGALPAHGAAGRRLAVSRRGAGALASLPGPHDPRERPARRLRQGRSRRAPAPPRGGAAAGSRGVAADLRRARPRDPAGRRGGSDRPSQPRGARDGRGLVLRQRPRAEAGGTLRARTVGIDGRSPSKGGRAPRLGRGRGPGAVERARLLPAREPVVPGRRRAALAGHHVQGRDGVHDHAGAAPAGPGDGGHGVAGGRRRARGAQPPLQHLGQRRRARGATIGDRAEVRRARGAAPLPGRPPDPAHARPARLRQAAGPAPDADAPGGRACRRAVRACAALARERAGHGRGTHGPRTCPARGRPRPHGAGRSRTCWPTRSSTRPPGRW